MLPVSSLCLSWPTLSTKLWAWDRKKHSAHVTYTWSFPFELDGYFLAVEEGGLIWWKIRIFIQNILLQTLLMKLFIGLLLYFDNGLVATYNGRINSPCASTCTFSSADSSTGNWPRTCLLSHCCIDGGRHGNWARSKCWKQARPWKIGRKSEKRGSCLASCLFYLLKVSQSNLPAPVFHTVEHVVLPLKGQYFVIRSWDLFLDVEEENPLANSCARVVVSTACVCLPCTHNHPEGTSFNPWNLKIAIGRETEQVRGRGSLRWQSSVQLVRRPGVLLGQDPCAGWLLE